MKTDSATGSPVDVLRRYWGYDTFRPMQREIIDSVLQGRDTLGLLPTGGGKSITFQVPAMMLPGLTIVVTPLISLMKDQIDNLALRGIRAACFHSGMRRSHIDLAMQRCTLGKVKIAYVSPERLQNRNFLAELRLIDVSLIVVDEAHCISQWGYDFRPSYLLIAALRDIFPAAPVLALTASATPRVAADIMERLQFRDGRMFSRSFARTNLSYIARYCDHKEGMLLKVLSNTAGTAIVYVRSRKRTRDIAALLAEAGISADYYHAGLDPAEKDERQNAWKDGRTRVIVATNAFGMGIDKPDVRVVVHIDLPPSLEEYYQEAGRAGRDGLPSYAVMLVAKSDKALLTRRIAEAFPPLDYIRRVYELACNFLDVAVGSGYGEVYEFNFNLFCDRFDLKPLVARAALGLLTRAGYLEFVEETTTRARLMVIMTRRDLYDLRLDAVTDAVLQMILRTYPGLFTDYVFINESLVATRCHLSAEQVYDALLYLGRLHVISYVPRKTTPFIYFTTSREEPRYIIMPVTVYDDRRRMLEERIRAMQRFAFDSSQCRSSMLLDYFGETDAAPCGLCDVCRDRRRAMRPAVPTATLDASITYLAGQPGGHTVDHITRQLAATAPRAEVIAAIRRLADDGILTLDGLNVALRR